VKPFAPLVRAACLLLFLFGRDASGQTTATAEAPLVRADVAGLAGWLHLHRPGLDYGEWIHGPGLIGGSAGWYWTDHLKTEIDGGVSSSAERFQSRRVEIEGQPVYYTSRLRFSTRSVAVGPQYQFYRNAWFHPFVGAGLALTWERTLREDDPVWGPDPTSGRTRLVSERRRFPENTDLVARAYAQAGFKAYVSQRAFFRSDLRLAIRKGVDEVAVRLGGGVDF
jgi:hypothetical protein